ncbi:glycoside hydrolase family 39 [Caldicellulosiruptor kronotskyensis 2002]|uniref:Glycoside hydrolase family 39 n=1 Tax=Caldicellulosiruptor kronotskyensis (strain DSM 18902 / VKM B-2412 / 2002) TaxID=632348 RepID=E4SHH9_CALK2|nr:beta-xylosidase [Caldicellulosiruptor kronotskyensis]ADQ47204.1 glycoside hydrolase family 39 [Caldicellulosiruptor kronotskyensis 2002]
MKINIYPEIKLGKINKFWTKCVGSCHAATALREDWRKQLKKCRQELGFKYVRFHGWLNDDMSVCFRNDEGKLWFSFFNIDSIIDFLLDIGMKPFIELSFMPEALASGTKTVFHYKGNITPPKSYEEWGQLVEELTRHLVKRYGKNEVREWFFEVWNEPNLKDFFWAGTMEEYFELYKHAAFAIKKVDSELKVGGPASAVDAWILELKEYCQRNGVPIDFISTHQYPTDLAFSTSSNMEEAMAKAKRGELAKRVKKALSEAEPLPLYYTEWNNSPSPRDPYHDIPYDAAFIVKTIIDIIDLPLGCYSYWTFTDIFEECGLSSLPFHGGFGLLNIHGIPKPSYRAFQILNKLDGEKVELKVEERSPTVDCIAAVNGNELVLVISNHNVPLSPINNEKITVTINGIRECKEIYAERIDEYNANPKRKWVEMGSPEYLNNEQIEELIKSSKTKKEEILWRVTGENQVTFEINILPHSVIGVSIKIE